MKNASAVWGEGEVQQSGPQKHPHPSNLPLMPNERMTSFKGPDAPWEGPHETIDDGGAGCKRHVRKEALQLFMRHWKLGGSIKGGTNPIMGRAG